MAVHLKDLPCGGCQKCTRAHESWNTFAEEVDDVAPLARPGTWTYLPESAEEPVRPRWHSTSAIRGNGKEKPEVLTQVKQLYITSPGRYCIRLEPLRSPVWILTVTL
jgi:hypothetical protein